MNIEAPPTERGGNELSQPTANDSAFYSTLVNPMFAASSTKRPSGFPGILLLLLVLFLAACASSASRRRAESFELPPEAGLAGVRLGMSYGELVRLRPAVKSVATGDLFNSGPPNHALQEDFLDEKFPTEYRFEGAGYIIKDGRLVRFDVAKEFSSVQDVSQAVDPYVAACLRVWGPNFRRRFIPPPHKYPITHTALVWIDGVVRRILQVSIPCPRGENFCVDIEVIGYEIPSSPGTLWDGDIDPEVLKRSGLDDDSLKRLQN